MKGRKTEKDTLSSRVFKRDDSIVKTKRKISAKAILIIVLSVILVLLCIALIVASNFLFDFALNPNASFTMSNLFQGGEVEGIGDGPIIQLTPERQAWREYTAEAYQWFETDGQNVELEQRLSGEVIWLHSVQFLQEGHKYAILFHGYTGASWQMAPYAKMFYDMGYSVITPDARAHGESEGNYIGMGWLERPDVLSWINSVTGTDPDAEIVLHGVSMGGATVMMAAGEDLPDNVKCIVEDCGYSSVWDEFRLQLKNVFGLPAFPLLNVASLVCQIRAGYSFTEASSVKQLQKATVPMLFIHGDADTFVPFSMLDVVFEACTSAEKEKLVVHDAAHGAAADTDPELYWDTVTTFVGKYITTESD